MAYRLPHLSLEQYRLLPADEQYLLISSIHALYERLLIPGSAPSNVVSLDEARQNAATTPRSAARKRAFRKGSSSAFIMEVFMEAGDTAALTPDEIFKRVLQKTQTTRNAIWRVLPALVQQGVLVKDGDGRAGGRYHLKR